MGCCQTKPYVPASDEITKKRAEMLKKRYEKTANMEELDWERAVKLAFPDKTYVITYDYHPGSINMRVSFVQFPDPFRQQLNPRGEPIGPSPLCPADEIALADKEREEKEKEKKEKEKEKEKEKA